MDIYFNQNYGKLYEEAEHGTACVWTYEGLEGKISHQFILREIPISTNDGPWFDIVTPYGYGGPIIQEISNGYEKSALIKAFNQAFFQYCKEQKIVSEFIRFHPIVKNAMDFSDIYETQCIRHTLGTNLELEDPIAEEFSKGCRKNIRRAVAKGISWRVIEKPTNIEVFKSIYYSTMDRNNASEYYYFNDEYFENCKKFFQENLLLVEAIFENKTIAAGLYFVANGIIHIHLSGTLSEYLYLSPAYILRYAITLWGKENGCHLIHHGGGRTNSIDDNLFAFKKQFAQKTEFEFCIGKKIWNQEIYDKLCAVKGAPERKDYFPAYRN